MADIHIHRDHTLGLAKARKMAWQWAETAEQKFDMACTVVEGDDRDVVEFTRAGVTGQLVVDADSFDLTARLGFLLGAFSGRIESEIESNLDALLAAAPAPSRATANTTAKSAKPAAKAPAKTRTTPRRS
ncbi:MAG: polyhydroxyalkanoic acid system family protein [Caldimonas sp.]